jgi:hypothetical protein
MKGKVNNIMANQYGVIFTFLIFLNVKQTEHFEKMGKHKLRPKKENN